MNAFSRLSAANTPERLCTFRAARSAWPLLGRAAMHTVHFEREKIQIRVEDGATLRDAAGRCGVRLYSSVFRFLNCFGFGRCGECRVIVTEGGECLSPITELERAFARPRQSRHKGKFGIYAEDGERLPCQARVGGDVSVWSRPRDGGPDGAKRPRPA